MRSIWGALSLLGAALDCATPHNPGVSASYRCPVLRKVEMSGPGLGKRVSSGAGRRCTGNAWSGIGRAARLAEVLTMIVKESACDASMRSFLEMYGIVPYIPR